MLQYNKINFSTSKYNLIVSYFLVKTRKQNYDYTINMRFGFEIT